MNINELEMFCLKLKKKFKLPCTSKQLILNNALPLLSQGEKVGVEVFKRVENSITVVR